ncbi:MAG: glycosyltransferase family 2 protein [Candidatus Helarchaeota archaeon]|nr:glycosyltransferase family 2 protein [Candidatus Helarchaeota archaeon]
MTSFSGPDISVVIPALDEEQSIETCINKIKDILSKKDLSYEIIVSDSSGDRTAELARRTGAIVVHPKKLGYGCAYIEGLRHIHGKYVVIGDADNTYDFSEVPLLISELDHGADLVIGSRFRGGIKEGAMKPLHQYIGNPLLTWILNGAFGTQFSDAHSGFRAIRSEALNKLDLQSCGMEFASEMLVKASREGLKISEVPVTYYPRVTPSKLNSFTDGWRHLRFILLLKPLAFLTLPGIFFSIFGLIIMAAFYTSQNNPDAHTHSFILGVLLLTGGLQLFLSGVVIHVYSAVHGFEQKDALVKNLLNYQILEICIVLGSVIILAGLIIGAKIMYGWIKSGFGSLDAIMSAILSLAFILIGLEIVFMAVLISMMCLNQETPSE